MYAIQYQQHSKGSQATASLWIQQSTHNTLLAHNCNTASNSWCPMEWESCGLCFYCVAFECVWRVAIKVSFVALELLCCICLAAAAVLDFAVVHVLCCIGYFAFAVLRLLCCLCCVAFQIVNLIEFAAMLRLLRCFGCMVFSNIFYITLSCVALGALIVLRIICMNLLYWTYSVIVSALPNVLLRGLLHLLSYFLCASIVEPSVNICVWWLWRAHDCKYKQLRVCEHTEIVMNDQI